MKYKINLLIAYILHQATEVAPTQTKPAYAGSQPFFYVSMRNAPSAAQAR
ncbi:MAG: hypothetical protein KAF91_05960 [Nostoc sp. TH1S01]|nr:hypothetical protein [Nostoc sp. TH1S01]